MNPPFARIVFFRKKEAKQETGEPQEHTVRCKLPYCATADRKIRFCGGYGQQRGNVTQHIGYLCF